ncbi:acetate kinase [Rhodopseudomonas rhenobacensis]|uniref:Acetate kinase n=1 Tax=Rhodopseudomonas rhenobacensis TaxID=87461 RepID=A0A7W7Z3K4_9BRAD|nr:acetate/propionate family kinase [Rhodopseudomonas rhenobacensis]MBB5047377.1 acetate kinase [Rhodopseudomonas rhenobacensis]
MTGAILVVNAGSSSLKFSLYPAGERPTKQELLCNGEVANIGEAAQLRATAAGGAVLTEHPIAAATHGDALGNILRWLDRHFTDYQVTAAGHRIVHGGAHYAAPVLVDDAVLATMRSLVPLAPLHEPNHIAAIEALARLHPGLPQVACFDTAFHHGQSEVATSYALPRAITAEGVRRYGFHGLSYEYIAGVLPDMLGEAAEGRVVVAHLGGGVSMCGLHRRRSVATTMGFTPLDGLPMATRCGTIDPSVVLYLLEENGMTPAAVRDLLYRHSGLLGVSGISGDMRTLLGSDDPHAAAAVELFVYRIGRELGSLAAALGGLDAIVFTAGIGEHSPEIRRRVLQQAAWLGVEIDEAAVSGPRLTSPASRVSAWIIPTDEDLMVARHAFALISGTGEP